MEKRRHFWNGSWGRLARRDVLLYEDGGQWLIEVRVGGAEGRSRWIPREDEDAALDELRALLSGTADWREL
ncbi:hypothetical protein GCM10009682_37090 [Luedemannella flava]|uniref:Uncharacterized protein n=1 Tax=Luedemannella flava TaxID=349316 RepID=A0ABN2M6X4_9ACTN